MLFDRGIVAPGVDGGYVASDSAFGGKAFPGPIRQYNPGTQPFLKVNRNGERFANESSPYNDIVYAAAHQPGRVCCTCVVLLSENVRKYIYMMKNISRRSFLQVCGITAATAALTACGGTKTETAKKDDG